MGKYAGDHRDALADVREAGTEVVFTHLGTPVYDPATDTTGEPVETVVAGCAVQVGGDPKRYAALNLVETEAPTLFFVPDTEGLLPPQGATTTWGGEIYAVRQVYDPVAIDGVAIAAYVLVVR